MSQNKLPAALPIYSELHVRLADIIGNFNYFKRLNRTAAVVKADAYGIGMAATARALFSAGAQEFYTFSLQEACDLRDILGAQAIIYFFEGLPQAEDAVLAAQYKVIPVLNRLSELSAWATCDWQAGARPLCVHVDSGMNRLGIPISDWRAFCDFYETHKTAFAPPLILSHLACSEAAAHDKNTEQRDKMLKLLEESPAALRQAQLSLSATGGALLGEAYRAAQLRIGIGLYGVSFGAPIKALKNPLCWQARVLQLRDLRAGESIGYGATPVGQATSAAIIACGYADGVKRCFADNGHGRVFINGQACAVLGRVSMDCFAVDSLAANAQEGDMAELIGERQSLTELAEAMQTSPYEVLCGIGKRVRRKFID